MFKEQVIEIRKELDYYSNYIGKAYPSREMSLVITHLQKSRMWFGEYLSLFPDSESPYAIKDGKRETVKDILPQADKTSLDHSIPIKNPIKEIDDLREWLKYQSEFFNQNWYKVFEPDEEVIEFDLKTQNTASNVLTNLKESRMWLGQVLNKINKQLITQLWRKQTEYYQDFKYV